MKKLSLVLALILVLTCGVLAACNDEGAESSAAESVEESTATSTEESTATSTEESTATSTEESTATSTEESTATSTEESTEADASAPEAGENNLALGKTYTRSQLYRQGGRDVNWAWDENAPIAYPDEDEKSLTDGAIDPAADAGYSDPVWAGFHYGCPDYETNGYSWITVDLGESKDLAKFVLHVGTKGVATGAGIAAPAKVEFLVSDDGETWTSVGEVTPEDTDDTTKPRTSAELSAAASGQYVQVRLSGSSFLFVSEIEVFGAAE